MTSAAWEIIGWSILGVTYLLVALGLWVMFRTR